MFFIIIVLLSHYDDMFIFEKPLPDNNDNYKLLLPNYIDYAITH